MVFFGSIENNIGLLGKKGALKCYPSCKSAYNVKMLHQNESRSIIHTFF